MTTTTTMQALVFEGPGQIALRALPKPRPGPGEVLVRVHRAAICGSDIRIVAGTKTRDVRPGHPIGHEAAGTVEAVGQGITAYTPGQRVAVCVVESCGQCVFCDAGCENLCPSRRTLGYHTDGAFAEYMLIPAHAVRRGNLFKLPVDLPMDVAPLIEPMACCLNGQQEMGLGDDQGPAWRRGGWSLVIFGAGPIGLMHLLIARARLAGTDFRVTVVEPQPHRRAMAEQLGADAVFAPDAFDQADAFDAAIIAVGVVELVPLAIRAVRPCGRVSLFAGFAVGAQAALDPNAIHYKQLRVHGASESRRSDFAQAMSLIAAGRVDPAPLLTHTFALADYQQAFDLAVQGTALKIAFNLLP